MHICAIFRAKLVCALGTKRSHHASRASHFDACGTQRPFAHWTLASPFLQNKQRRNTPHIIILNTCSLPNHHELQRQPKPLGPTRVSLFDGCASRVLQKMENFKSRSMLMGIRKKGSSCCSAPEFSGESLPVRYIQPVSPDVGRCLLDWWTA